MLIFAEPTVREDVYNPMTYSAPAVSALTVRDPWALVPSLGNLDAYITAVNRVPLLTQEEESAFSLVPEGAPAPEPPVTAPGQTPAASAPAAEGRAPAGPGR